MEAEIPAFTRGSASVRYSGITLKGEKTAHKGAPFLYFKTLLLLLHRRRRRGVQNSAN